MTDRKAKMEKLRKQKRKEMKLKGWPKDNIVNNYAKNYLKYDTADEKEEEEEEDKKSPNKNNGTDKEMSQNESFMSSASRD